MFDVPGFASVFGKNQIAGAVDHKAGLRVEKMQVVGSAIRQRISVKLLPGVGVLELLNGLEWGWDFVGAGSKEEKG